MDVRERHELELAKLPHFTLLSMSEYDRWADGERENSRQGQGNNCHVSPAQISAYLTQVGFTNVRNLVGGIDAVAQASNIYTDRY